ncbi:uncharacterized protein [Bombus fervidus]|uniref:uncharacterized protein n=1 Tax=Bombus fervidus TaxID=203811 RepID=UPI003AB12B19
MRHMMLVISRASGVRRKASNPSFICAINLLADHSLLSNLRSVLKMTALLRWVLLALLLAMVVAHPVQHACVYFCRAQNINPERATGGCGDQQEIIRQLSEGQFPIHRLFRICLIPCNGTDSVTFDNSHTCRTFREVLIRCYGCSCNNVNYDEVRNEEEDLLMIKTLEENQMKGADMMRMLEKTAEQHIHQSQGLNSRYIRRHITEIKVEKDIIQADLKDTGNLNKADSEETSKDAATGNLEKPGCKDDASCKEDSTDETSVDWERWCMKQCDNGKGGSACNCDIIP